MKYKISLPSAYVPDRECCFAAMAPEFRGNVDLIDNAAPNKNIGVSRAWNQTATKVLEENLDWLIILSTSVIFGAKGGMDFIQALAEREGHTVVEAMAIEGQLFGWHYLAFSRECLERVGLFDENLPVYFGDIDYSLRIQRAYNIDGRQQQLWEKAPVDCEDLGMARSNKLAGVNDPAEPRINYFQTKWGKHPGSWQEEGYPAPFNDPSNDIKYWPEIQYERDQV